jgi:polysaccharide deacetylase 2 family uncharacterized protein YibQ
MIRESLIRRLPEICFALLFGGGVALGGDAALAGLPKFLDAAVPAAKADVSRIDPSGEGSARLRLVPEILTTGFAESRHTPQVLYPVTASPMPDWLVEAIRVDRLGPPPALRGVRVAENSAATHLQRPVIAICIDDLGEDLAGTDKAMALPKDVALSFLPFAETTPFLAEAAARKGHLVLAHVPMQAINGQDPGPMGLKSGMAQDEIARQLGWNLARVPGLVGINNHEGSRFTADAVALAPVMASLKARHLFFFDSRTGPQSAVGRAARAAGVMTAPRDVFLDDDPSPAAVSAELEMLAREAKRTGIAIAIGHPHDVTLKLLARWLAQDHGVTLVPLDEAIRMKVERQTAVAVR